MLDALAERCVCLHRPAVCSQCNDCRELDLCRDPALQAGSWACPCCKSNYDAAAIEARLVAALQGRLKNYVLQDLVCTQCKQVSHKRHKQRMQGAQLMWEPEQLLAS